MNKKLFGHLSPRVLGAAAVTSALLVPLGVFGAPALARSASAASQYEYGGSSQYQYKIWVCHHTHSKKHPWVQLHVSVNAWKGHQHHDGDYVGTCAPGSTNQSTGKNGKDHGKSNVDHGKSGQDHGKGK